MKKSIKIYLWAWLIVALSFFLLFALFIIGTNPRHGLYSDPSNIIKIIKLELPDMIGDSRYDGGSSSWGCYIYEGEFVEKISDDCLLRLNNLCLSDSKWHKGVGNNYHYHEEKYTILSMYSIDYYISETSYTLEYCCDEEEGLGLFLILIMVVVILIIWGMVLLLISLIVRCSKWIKSLNFNQKKQ